MNVIHKYNTSDSDGKQLYHYFDGKEWVEKWERNDYATKTIMENHIEALDSIRNQVLTEQLSPLAYHIEIYSFNIKLLSAYTGIPKRLINKHLKPENFNQLDEDTLKKYALAFGISVEELKKI